MHNILLYLTIYEYAPKNTEMVKERPPTTKLGSVMVQENNKFDYTPHLYICSSKQCICGSQSGRLRGSEKQRNSLRIKTDSDSGS